MNIKNINIFIGIIMILLIMNSSTVQAADNMSDASLTMGEIEHEIDDYLKEHHSDIKVGTPMYIDFLVEQLMEGSDEYLKSKDNYEEICTYAAKYLSLVDEKQVLSLDEKEVLNLSNEEKRITINEIKKESLGEIPCKEIIIEKNNVKTATSYSSSKAVQYAREWALGRNTAYGKWANDCTNFVSQAVYNGGISMRKPSTIEHGTKSTTSYWYSKKHSFTGSTGRVTTEYDVSTSWIRVSDFYTYAKNHGATIINCSNKSYLQNQCKPGDVVQLYHEGGWYHSIIITGGSKGNRTYCGHTNNKKDAKVSSISDSSKYRIIRY